MISSLGTDRLPPVSARGKPYRLTEPFFPLP